MKCPHCHKVSRSPVLESRSCEGSVWRRRRCSICQQTYVSTEVSSIDTKMPSGAQWRNRVEAVEVKKGAHLQSLWGKAPPPRMAKLSTGRWGADE